VSVAKKPNRLLAPFYDRLPAEFDSFSRRGTMLLKVGGGRFLCGFYFHPGNDYRCITYFLQPLYVPEHDVVFGWGYDLKADTPSGLLGLPQYIGLHNPSALNRTVHSMMQGLAVLEGSCNPEGFYELLSSRTWGMTADMHLYMALAATAILLGSATDALRHIQDALIEAALNPLKPGEHISEKLGPGVFTAKIGLQPWEVEILDRLKLLRALLDAGDIEAAVSQLDEWQRFTVAALKIEDLLVSGG
jgi:hypothetical protein